MGKSQSGVKLYLDDKTVEQVGSLNSLGCDIILYSTSIL
jgi:hypothetical protein